MFQKCFGKFLRATAIVTLVTYIPTNFSYAGVTGAAPEISLPAAWQLSQSLALGLPAELGRIESLSPGRKGIIFHLQTAHGHYEAQVKIQKILEQFAGQYGSYPVLLEGAAGRLNAERINFFPKNPERTKAAAHLLAKKALVKGPELYLLDHPSALVQGIENEAAYWDNHHQFTSVLRAREATQTFSEEFDREMEKTAAIFAPALRGFLKRAEQHELGIVSYESWIEELRNAAQKHLKVDLTDAAWQLPWPMLVRFFKIQKISKAWDSQKYEKEKPLFIRDVEKYLTNHKVRITNHELFDRIKQLLDSAGKNVQLPEPETENAFAEMLRYLPRDFDFKTYPNVTRFMGLLILQSELRPAALVSEMQRIEQLVMNQLARDESEKEIGTVFSDYRLLKKTLALQLTPDDFRKIIERTATSVQRAAKMQPSQITERLKALNNQRRAQYSVRGTGYAEPSSNSVHEIKVKYLKELDGLFNLAIEFYQGAKKRDELMIQNTENYLQKNPAKFAVLVTGGFHTDAMRKQFEKEGYAYAVVTPAISGPDEEGYKAYLKNMLQSSTAYSVQRTAQTTSGSVLGANATGTDPHALFNRNQNLESAYGTDILGEATRRSEFRMLVQAARDGNLSLPHRSENRASAEPAEEELPAPRTSAELAQRTTWPTSRISKAAYSAKIEKRRGRSEARDKRPDPAGELVTQDEKRRRAFSNQATNRLNSKTALLVVVFATAFLIFGPLWLYLDSVTTKMAAVDAQKKQYFLDGGPDALGEFKPVVPHTFWDTLVEIWQWVLVAGQYVLAAGIAVVVLKIVSSLYFSFRAMRDARVGYVMLPDSDNLEAAFDRLLWYRDEKHFQVSIRLNGDGEHVLDSQAVSERFFAAIKRALISDYGAGRKNPISASYLFDNAAKKVTLHLKTRRQNPKDRGEFEATNLIEGTFLFTPPWHRRSWITKNLNRLADQMSAAHDEKQTRVIRGMPRSATKQNDMVLVFRPDTKALSNVAMYMRVLLAIWRHGYAVVESRAYSAADLRYGIINQPSILAQLSPAMEALSAGKITGNKDGGEALFFTPEQRSLFQREALPFMAEKGTDEENLIGAGALLQKSGLKLRDLKALYQKAPQDIFGEGDERFEISILTLPDAEHIQPQFRNRTLAVLNVFYEIEKARFIESSDSTVVLRLRPLRKFPLPVSERQVALLRHFGFQNTTQMSVDSWSWRAQEDDPLLGLGPYYSFDSQRPFIEIMLAEEVAVALRAWFTPQITSLRSEMRVELQGSEPTFKAGSLPPGYKLLKFDFTEEDREKVSELFSGMKQNLLAHPGHNAQRRFTNHIVKKVFGLAVAPKPGVARHAVYFVITDKNQIAAVYLPASQQEGLVKEIAAGHIFLPKRTTEFGPVKKHLERQGIDKKDISSSAESSAAYLESQNQSSFVFASPARSEMREFKHDNLNWKIAADEEVLSKAAVDAIAKVLLAKPKAVFLLPAGKTSVRMYEILAERANEEEIDLTPATIFMLTEYRAGKTARAFIDEHMNSPIARLKRPSAIYVLDGTTREPQKEAEQYERMIAEAGGVDLAVLEIGNQGEIGFNEVGASFDSPAREVTLSDTLRAEHQVSSMKGFTVGMRVILDSRKKILLISGASKAKIAGKLFGQKPDLSLPASVLKQRGNTDVLITEDAEMNMGLPEKMQGAPGFEVYQERVHAVLAQVVDRWIESDNSYKAYLKILIELVKKNLRVAPFYTFSEIASAPVFKEAKNIHLLPEILGNAEVGMREINVFKTAPALPPSDEDLADALRVKRDTELLAATTISRAELEKVNTSQEPLGISFSGREQKIHAVWWGLTEIQRSDFSNYYGIGTPETPLAPAASQMDIAKARGNVTSANVGASIRVAIRKLRAFDEQPAVDGAPEELGLALTDLIAEILAAMPAGTELDAQLLARLKKAGPKDDRTWLEVILFSRQKALLKMYADKPFAADEKVSLKDLVDAARGSDSVGKSVLKKSILKFVAEKGIAWDLLFLNDPNFVEKAAGPSAGKGLRGISTNLKWTLAKFLEHADTDRASLEEAIKSKTGIFAKPHVRMYFGLRFLGKTERENKEVIDYLARRYKGQYKIDDEWAHDSIKLAKTQFHGIKELPKAETAAKEVPAPAAAELQADPNPAAPPMEITPIAAPDGILPVEGAAAEHDEPAAAPLTTDAPAGNDSEPIAAIAAPPESYSVLREMMQRSKLASPHLDEILALRRKNWIRKILELDLVGYEARLADSAQKAQATREIRGIIVEAKIERLIESPHGAAEEQAREVVIKLKEMIHWEDHAGDIVKIVAPEPKPRAPQPAAAPSPLAAAPAEPELPPVDSATTKDFQSDLRKWLNLADHNSLARLLQDAFLNPADEVKVSKWVRDNPDAEIKLRYLEKHSASPRQQRELFAKAQAIYKRSDYPLLDQLNALKSELDALIVDAKRTGADLNPLLNWMGTKGAGFKHNADYLAGKGFPVREHLEAHANAEDLFVGRSEMREILIEAVSLDPIVLDDGREIQMFAIDPNDDLNWNAIREEGGLSDVIDELIPEDFPSPSLLFTEIQFRLGILDGRLVLIDDVDGHEHRGSTTHRGMALGLNGEKAQIEAATRGAQLTIIDLPAIELPVRIGTPAAAGGYTPITFEVSKARSEFRFAPMATFSVLAKKIRGIDPFYAVLLGLVGVIFWLNDHNWGGAGVIVALLLLIARKAGDRKLPDQTKELLANIFWEINARNIKTIVFYVNGNKRAHQIEVDRDFEPILRKSIREVLALATNNGNNGIAWDFPAPDVRDSTILTVNVSTSRSEMRTADEKVQDFITTLRMKRAAVDFTNNDIRIALNPSEVAIDESRIPTFTGRSKEIFDIFSFIAYRLGLTVDLVSLGEPKTEEQWLVLTSQPSDTAFLEKLKTTVETRYPNLLYKNQLAASDQDFYAPTKKRPFLVALMTLFVSIGGMILNLPALSNWMKSRGWTSANDLVSSMPLIFIFVASAVVAGATYFVSSFIARKFAQHRSAKNLRKAERLDVANEKWPHNFNKTQRSELREAQLRPILEGSTDALTWFQAFSEFEPAQPSDKVIVTIQIARGIRMQVPIWRAALTDPELQESAYRYLSTWTYNLSARYGTSFAAIGTEGTAELIDVARIEHLLTRENLAAVHQSYEASGGVSSFGISNYANGGESVEFKKLSELTDAEKEEKPLSLNIKLRTDAPGSYLGVDIGGGSAKFAVIRNGKILDIPEEFQSLPTVLLNTANVEVQETPQQYSERIAGHIEKIGKALGIRFDGIGIDTPGAKHLTENKMVTLGQLPVVKKWDMGAVKEFGRLLPLTVAQKQGLDSEKVMIRNDMDGVLPGVASVLPQIVPEFWKRTGGNFRFDWMGTGHGNQDAIGGLPMNAPTEAGHFVHDFARPGAKVFDTEASTSIPGMILDAITQVSGSRSRWDELLQGKFKPLAEEIAKRPVDANYERGMIAARTLRRFANEYAANLAIHYWMTQSTGKGSPDEIVFGGGIVRKGREDYFKNLILEALKKYDLQDKIRITVISDEDLKKANMSPDNAGPIGMAMFIQSVLASNQATTTLEPNPITAAEWAAVRKDFKVDDDARIPLALAGVSETDAQRIYSHLFRYDGPIQRVMAALHKLDPRRFDLHPILFLVNDDLSDYDPNWGPIVQRTPLKVIVVPVSTAFLQKVKAAPAGTLSEAEMELYSRFAFSLTVARMSPAVHMILNTENVSISLPVEIILKMASWDAAALRNFEEVLGYKVDEGLGQSNIPAPAYLDPNVIDALRQMNLGDGRADFLEVSDALAAFVNAEEIRTAIRSGALDHARQIFLGLKETKGWPMNYLLPQQIDPAGVLYQDEMHAYLGIMNHLILIEQFRDALPAFYEEQIRALENAQGFSAEKVALARKYLEQSPVLREMAVKQTELSVSHITQKYLLPVSRLIGREILREKIRQQLNMGQEAASKLVFTGLTEELFERAAQLAGKPTAQDVGVDLSHASISAKRNSGGEPVVIPFAQWDATTQADYRELAIEGVEFAKRSEFRVSNHQSPITNNVKARSEMRESVNYEETLALIRSATRTKVENVPDTNLELWKFYGGANGDERLVQVEVFPKKGRSVQFSGIKVFGRGAGGYLNDPWNAALFADSQVGANGEVAGLVSQHVADQRKAKLIAAARKKIQSRSEMREVEVEVNKVARNQILAAIVTGLVKDDKGGSVHLTVNTASVKAEEELKALGFSFKPVDALQWLRESLSSVTKVVPKPGQMQIHAFVGEIKLVIQLTEEPSAFGDGVRHSTYLLPIITRGPPVHFENLYPAELKVQGVLQTAEALRAFLTNTEVAAYDGRIISEDGVAAAQREQEVRKRLGTSATALLEKIQAMQAVVQRLKQLFEGTRSGLLEWTEIEQRTAGLNGQKDLLAAAEAFLSRANRVPVTEKIESVRTYASEIQGFRTTLNAAIRARLEEDQKAVAEKINALGVSAVDLAILGEVNVDLITAKVAKDWDWGKRLLAKAMTLSAAIDGLSPSYDQFSTRAQANSFQYADLENKILALRQMKEHLENGLLNAVKAYTPVSAWQHSLRGAQNWARTHPRSTRFIVVSIAVFIGLTVFFIMTIPERREKARAAAARAQEAAVLKPIRDFVNETAGNKSETYFSQEVERQGINNLKSAEIARTSDQVDAFRGVTYQNWKGFVLKDGRNIKFMIINFISLAENI